MLSAPDKFSCSGFLLLDGVREPDPVSAVIPKPVASRRPSVFYPAPLHWVAGRYLQGNTRRGLYPYYSPFWAVIRGEAKYGIINCLCGYYFYGLSIAIRGR